MKPQVRGREKVIVKLPFDRQQHCALEYKQVITAMEANVFNTFPIIFLFYYRLV